MLLTTVVYRVLETCGEAGPQICSTITITGVNIDKVQANTVMFKLTCIKEKRAVK